MDTHDYQGSRILIVEDELIVAADLEGSLHDLGFQVVGAVGNAEQAIETAHRERPDLILMDVQLHGEMAGIRVADTVRRTWNIPVVFLTAYTNEDILQRARAAGAYGFLSKPFRIEDLKASILIALEQHRVSLELFAEHNWLVTMLGSLSDGVIASDPSGCVRYMNSVAEDMTQWRSAEAIGKPIEEIYPLCHLDGSPVPQCQLRRALLTKSAVAKDRFRMHVRHDDTIPVEDAAAPIIEEGRLLGAVTIFRDITARLQAEAEQQMQEGRLQQEVRSSNAALGQSREELRALSGRLITAQEDERRRVARELHDDLGQRVALMSWQVEKLSRRQEELSVEAQREVQVMQTELNQLSSGLRDVSHRLHPAIIADLGLAPALQDLAERNRAQGVDVAVVAREVPSPLPEQIATALYRIAQEALRNAVQHAPGSPVLITLTSEERILKLIVEDPGPGFDLGRTRRKGGLGLLSMQERVRVLGGTFEIHTAHDAGTRIITSVPLEQA